MGESEAQATAPRLLRRLSYGELLRLLAVVALGVSILALSPPLSLVLFAVEPGVFPDEVSAAFDGARLITGVAGLVMLAVGRRSRRLSTKPSPVRVGDLLMLAAAGLLGLCVVEGGLRVRGARLWGSMFRTPIPMKALRLDTFTVPRPGVYVRTATSDFDPFYQAVTLYSVNGYGQRGRLPVVPKPAGIDRIVCLGGSTTFGWSVADGEDWPSQLGRLLGDSVDVVNAGRPGATTFRDFTYLRDRLLPLEPDIVVFYEGYNDMWRGVRRHRRERPDYGIVGEGLPPSNEPLEVASPLRWPWRPLFLTYHVGSRIDTWLERPVERKPGPDAGAAPFVFDPAIVAMYEHNLGALVRLCREHDVVPVVATFAACDDSSLPEAEQRRRLGLVLREMPALDLASASTGLALYRAVTRDVAHREGVPLIDLATLMTKDLAAYTDTVHFTPEGERRLAELVVAGLREAGLVESGPAL